MKIAITGATGFIGSYLVDHLKNKHELLILSRRQKKSFSSIFQNVRFVNIRDLGMIKNSLNGIDTIVHLGAIRLQKDLKQQNFTPYINNIVLTSQLFEIAKELDVKRFINISTKGVYGKMNSSPFCESEKPQPDSYYGLSKKMAEDLTTYFNNQGISGISLRLNQVIGWGESQKNIVSTFLENALKKQPQQIWGNGMGSRSYVYVKDVVSAIEKAIESNVTGTFNIGWPIAYSHTSVAKCINSVFCNDNMTFLPEKAEDKFIEEIDTSKAKKILQWSPKFSTLEEALQDMKKDYEEKNIYWI